MALTVRPATLADAAEIVEFNRVLAEETEGKVLDLSRLRAGVDNGLKDPRKARYFVAEEDGVIAGQIMVTTEWSDWRNGWMWWIQSVYVRPERRRRGIFRALFDHVRQTAANDPEVVGLRLYVEDENHVAQKTYEQLGMERTGYFVLERCPL